MLEKRCLLSVKVLLEDEELFHKACKKLDEQRLKKVQMIKGREGKAQSVGAGLLLQGIVQERLFQSTFLAGDIVVSQNEGQPRLTGYTVQELLDSLESPVEIEYSYGRLGKPYLQKKFCCFSLSHSGEYVFCAVSDREIGADIQRCLPRKDHNLEKRFFSERERLLLEGRSGEERENLFYRLWTKKEAYGKLTGDGIGQAVGMDTEALSDRVSFEEWQLPGQYCMAVCRYLVS